MPSAKEMMAARKKQREEAGKAAKPSLKAKTSFSKPVQDFGVVKPVPTPTEPTVAPAVPQETQQEVAAVVELPPAVQGRGDSKAKTVVEPAPRVQPVAKKSKPAKPTKAGPNKVSKPKPKPVAKRPSVSGTPSLLSQLGAKTVSGPTTISGQPIKEDLLVLLNEFNTIEIESPELWLPLKKMSEDNGKGKTYYNDKLVKLVRLGLVTKEGDNNLGTRVRLTEEGRQTLTKCAEYLPS